MIYSLFKSQDDVIFYILFSDFNLFYLIYGRSIFSKWPKIGMVFLATVCLRYRHFNMVPFVEVILLSNFSLRVCKSLGGDISQSYFCVSCAYTNFFVPL